MTVVALDDPPSTVPVGLYTDRTNGSPSSDDVCVSTRPDWPQQEFLAWFDATKQRLGISSDNQMAVYLGIGHTLISGWRNNRQRPSFETLNLIARVLEIDPRHLWVLVGLVSPGEVGLLDDDQPARPLELPPAVVELLDLLEDPRLDAAARDQLLGTVRVLVAGTRAGLAGDPPRVIPPRRPGRKAS